MDWRKSLRGRVLSREPLKAHTSFKIGGPARFFIQPRDTADLKLLITLLKRDKIPVLIIGAGSNVLADDKGVRSVVVSLSSPFFQQIFFMRNIVSAGSGLLLSRLVSQACLRGLSGIEFLAGIPGTLGGALVMNAGAWGGNIGELVQDIRVMDYKGRFKVLSQKDAEFSYRESALGKYIILAARLKLRCARRAAVRKRIEENLSRRRQTQDTSLPSAGCIFKNPAGESAGKLIELCGLKGKAVGGARVSLKHANFILNSAGAKATDVLNLMGLIRREVKNKFKVNLEPEIKIWN
jgi:UDP-N-acetylmuramate dehydrogenase